MRTSILSIILGLLLLVILVAGVGAGANLISKRQPTTYKSVAVVAYGTSHPELAVFGPQFTGGPLPDERVTATDVLSTQSPSVAAEAAQKLHVRTREVTSKISVSAKTGANAVQIEGEGGTPQAALRYTSVYVDALVETRRSASKRNARAVISQLKKQLAQLVQTRAGRSASSGLRSQIASESSISRVGFGVPTVLQSAGLPTSPAGPQTQRNTLFGAIFGLVLGIALLSLLTRARRSRPAHEEEYAA